MTTTQQEQWRELPTWEGRYEVSDQGHVRDVHRRNREPELVPMTVMRDGTVQVYLHHNMRRRWPRVHQLVAQAWLPNPDRLPCVEHLNGNPQDNRLENLRWSYYQPVRSIDHDDTDAEQYRPVPSVEGLEVSAEGCFRYRGKPKAVTGRGRRSKAGQQVSLRINIMRDRQQHSWQASRLVAEAWLRGYEPGDLIIYRDGDCQNIAAQNLALADEREHDQYMRRRSLMQADTLQERKRKLRLVADETLMTLHYFETLDMTEINRHVTQYLYPTLMQFSMTTLHMGEKLSREAVPEVIGTMYEKIMAGMALYNYERFCKKMLHRLKKTGRYGEYWHSLVRPIQIEVEQLNLDCLWERYKVTKQRS